MAQNNIVKSSNTPLVIFMPLLLFISTIKVIANNPPAKIGNTGGRIRLETSMIITPVHKPFRKYINKLFSIFISICVIR